MLSNTIEFRVEWGETDTAGIIYYPNYYRWFDRATHALFRAAGMPVVELVAQHGWAHPVAETGCRFLAPLYYDDLVTVETSVSEVRRRTFRLEHRVRRGETITGEGFELRAWIKLGEPGASGRLAAIEIPAEYAARLRGEKI